MNTTIKLAAALGGAVLVAAGGTAFTASNTVPTNFVAGYGEAAVTGAVLENVHNTFSDDGTMIITTLLTFADPVQGQTIKASLAAEGADLGTTCVVGSSPFDTATCTWAGTTGISTKDADSLAVLVSKDGTTP